MATSLPDLNPNTNRPRQSWVVYLLIGLSFLIGGLSMVLFGVFLYTGMPALLPVAMTPSTSLCLNTLLCVQFFIQHSLMLRTGFRKRLSALIPMSYHGALYSIASGVSLIVLMLFWQSASNPVVSLEGPFYILVRGMVVVAGVGFVYTYRSLHPFDPFGIRDLLTRKNTSAPMEPAFTIRGAYQRVRHPLYFLCLIVIWAHPAITADRLLFNILWTVWIILGTRLEEKDLVAVFGDAYRDYQRSVPMLIPRLMVCKNQDRH